MRVDVGLNWTLGQRVTFFAFYTPIGWAVMAVLGLLMWATLPVWVVLTLAVLAWDRCHESGEDGPAT